jgi:hypothetical protein
MPCEGAPLPIPAVYIQGTIIIWLMPGTALCSWVLGRSSSIAAIAFAVLVLSFFWSLCFLFYVCFWASNAKLRLRPACHKSFHTQSSHDDKVWAHLHRSSRRNVLSCLLINLIPTVWQSCCPCFCSCSCPP